MRTLYSRTVNEFIDENEVILDRLFIDLSEIRLCDRVETVAVLEYKRSIGVTPNIKSVRGYT